jgi:NTE family protein
MAIALLLMVLLVCTASSPCADGSTSERPRIGLVLSGGGARGAAHVGVLKVLEELNVPIDCIAGTSMGAVVGGLYASGLSPQEIATNLRGIDWYDLFDDSPPRRHLPLRQKQAIRASLFDFELGLGPHGLLFPGGLVAGQKLEYLLESLTLRCAGAADFDELPIPFRAVATDIETGGRVVLSEGSIAEAMRASMAVPGAFTPVDLDGRTLVDGGLVSNLPIDLVRSMSADVVIAVDIGPKVGSLDQGSSAARILEQSLYLLMDQNAQDQRELLEPADILITPELGDMSPADFAATPSAIDSGERDAWTSVQALTRLSASEEEFGRFLRKQRRSAAQPPGALTVDSIQVRGATRVDPRIIKAVIRTKTGGPLRLDVLKNDLDRVYELGQFERVTFRVERSDSVVTLVIDTKEKSWGPHIIKAGFKGQADFRGRSSFTLLGGLRTMPVNAHGGEWETLVRLGEENGVSTGLYQPIGFSGLFFITPRVTLNEKRREVFSGSSNEEQLDVSVIESSIDAGIRLRNYGEIRVGGFLGRQKVTADPGDLAVKAAMRGYSASLSIDQLDSVGFPRSGGYVHLEGRTVHLDSDPVADYGWATFGACGAVSLGRHALVAIAGAGSSLGSTLPIYEQFEMGGPFSLSGYERGQLTGRYFGLGELVYHFRLLRLARPLGTGIYAGVSAEVGNVWSDEADVAWGDLRYAGSLFLGADTMLGALYIGLGVGEDGHSSGYASLGIPLVRG